MSETLQEALRYAATDSVWLDNPRYQQRYIVALAAEVTRLQDVLAVQDAQFQHERGTFRKQMAELSLPGVELRDASERLTLQKWGPKTANHPSVGTKCAACDLLFQPGDFTTAISMGPGIDKEARAAAVSGAPYTAVALEVHWACATGEEL